MTLAVSPRRLLTNRSTLTARFGLAGLPVPELWPHVIAAERYWDDKELLPAGSGYEMLCGASTSGGQSHTGGRDFFAVIDSLRDDHVREAIDVYDLGEGWYELFGGHHRAVAAYVANQNVPIKPDLAFEPVSQLKDVAAIERAYAAVEKLENLPAGRSYNTFKGRTSFRGSIDRLKMIYRAIVSAYGPSVLDAGCNDGYFGCALSAHGFQPEFIDMSGAYCDVVRAKLKALKVDANVHNCTITDYTIPKQYTIVLYTDVFYHTATKVSIDAAMLDFEKLLRATRRAMVFSPGRWDKLRKAGFTELRMMETAMRLGFRIRYLGRDSDPGYWRELYLICK